MDVLTKKQRSFNMSRIKAKDSKPEIYVRESLKENKIKGFSLHSLLPGKPDIIFREQKISVFVDGCFWHKCPKCFKEPATRKEFWQKKISENVLRDKRVNKELKEKGWTVIRIWEHQIKKDKSCKFLIRRIENITNRINQ